MIFNLYSSASSSNTSKDRTPNFIYFDDFRPYMNETTLEQISDFTKHNIGLTISGETLETMSRKITKTELLDTFASKFIFGDTSFDEMQVWANHFGTKKDWTGGKPNADDSTVEEIIKLDDSLKWDNVPLIGAGKIMGAKRGAPVYRIRKDKGGYDVGAVKLSEITDEYYSGFKSTDYNFESADSRLEQDITYKGNGLNIFNKNDKNNKKVNISGPIRYN